MGNPRSWYLCDQLLGESSSAAADFDTIAVSFDRCLTFDLINEAKADLQPVLTLAYSHFRYVIIFSPHRSNNLLGFSWGWMLQSH